MRPNSASILSAEIRRAEVYSHGPYQHRSPLGRIDLIQRDGQVAAAVSGCVVQAVGVELQLAVAPAGDAVHRAVADLVRPDVGIGADAGRVVELVAPDQLPLAGRSLGGRGGLVVQQVDA